MAGTGDIFNALLKEFSQKKVYKEIISQAVMFLAITCGILSDNIYKNPLL